MKGTSKDWQIANNSFSQNNDDSPAPLSIDSTVINNSGYNPVGAIANPWRATGDLTNDGAGSADSVNGQLYTVRQSAKTIIIKGGDVSESTPTGLYAGVFKLGIGEAIAVTYNTSPTSAVVAD